MRTRSLYRTFPNSQKFHVLVEGVHFIATAKALQETYWTRQTAAQMAALAALDSARLNTAKDGRLTNGISGRWQGLNVQLDLL